MIWLNKIQDLQYYNQQQDVPCYCELVVFPADMQLQGTIPNGGGTYTLKIYVYSADGMTQYENATSYFNYYFAVNPQTGQHFFNAQLNAFSPAMCSHACYILRAVVNEGAPLFDKYTERYCQNNCCDTARGIYYGQSDMVVGGGGGTITPVVPDLPPSPAFAPTGDCGEPIIRLISKFDCYDNFSGIYYGTPGTALSGTTANFSLTRITNLKGRVVQRPREIKRELSYNCKLQSSESTVVYLLEGYEYFPAWKMAEIEDQLHANHIYVDDYSNYKEYQYSGGTPFKQIHKCFEVFKLEAILEDCTVRQIFGCGDDCNKAGSELYFALPDAYNGGNFYTENRTLVAEDYDGLLVYLRGLDGMSNGNYKECHLGDVPPATVPCQPMVVMNAVISHPGGNQNVYHVTLSITNSQPATNFAKVFYTQTSNMQPGFSADNGSYSNPGPVNLTPTFSFPVNPKPWYGNGEFPGYRITIVDACNKVVAMEIDIDITGNQHFRVF